VKPNYGKSRGQKCRLVSGSRKPFPGRGYCAAWEPARSTVAATGAKKVVKRRAQPVSMVSC
jgi:hypothetical protein